MKFLKLILVAVILNGCVFDSGAGPEFYKRRAAIAAMAYRYAKHHPVADYKLAVTIGTGVNDEYAHISVTALDIATYIQNRDPFDSVERLPYGRGLPGELGRVFAPGL
jgi:hypothetical protein